MRVGFKSTSELMQGSSLLQVLRKIYLYLHFDAFNPAQVSLVSTQEKAWELSLKLTQHHQYWLLF